MGKITIDMKTIKEAYLEGLKSYRITAPIDDFDAGSMGLTASINCKITDEQRVGMCMVDVTDEIAQLLNVADVLNMSVHDTLKLAITAFCRGVLKI